MTSDQMRSPEVPAVATGEPEPEQRRNNECEKDEITVSFKTKERCSGAWRHNRFSVRYH